MRRAMTSIDGAFSCSPSTCRGGRLQQCQGGRRGAVARPERKLSASAGSVDRAMRTLGLFGVRRDKGVRIVDVHAQRIVAWHAATTKQTDLVMIPLRVALWQRGREGHPTEPGELIHHSDAGSQCTSLRLTEHLALEDIRPSIGTVGDAYDNALMESIIGLYKAECIRTTVFHDGPYKTIADVEYATAGWVDWYNNRGSTRPSATSRRSSTSKPTTLPSTESRTPYRNGREPGALQTEGRTYYRRKLAAGKTKIEALRCLKRRISDAIYRQLLADARAQPNRSVGTGPGGHCGATQESSAVDLPPHIDTSDQPLPGPAKPTLQPTPRQPERPPANDATDHRLTTEGSRNDRAPETQYRALSGRPASPPLSAAVRETFSIVPRR